MAAHGPRPVPQLGAGIILLDILINLPAFSPASPVFSLLAPSLDLLVVLALLLGVSQAGPRFRSGFSLAVSVLLVLMLGWKAVERLGPGQALQFLQAGPALLTAGVLAAAAAVLVGAALASFHVSRLVLAGFADPLLRSLFLAAAAICAVTQALTGIRIFSASEVPRIIREIGRALR